MSADDRLHAKIQKALLGLMKYSLEEMPSNPVAQRQLILEETEGKTVCWPNGKTCDYISAHVSNHMPLPCDPDLPKSVTCVVGITHNVNTPPAMNDAADISIKLIFDEKLQRSHPFDPAGKNNEKLRKNIKSMLESLAQVTGLSSFEPNLIMKGRYAADGYITHKKEVVGELRVNQKDKQALLEAIAYLEKGMDKAIADDDKERSQYLDVILNGTAPTGSHSIHH